MNFWPIPRGRGKKNLCRCMCHSCELLTHKNWLNSGKKFFNPQPPLYLHKSDPWGMTQVMEWKSRLLCFISFICKKTHKVWFKNIWNWLSNWNLMLFDLLAPPQGFRGRGKKKVLLRAPFMWATHTPNLVGFRPMV